jgi:hypothetical protein
MQALPEKVRLVGGDRDRACHCRRCGAVRRLSGEGVNEISALLQQGRDAQDSRETIRNGHTKLAVVAYPMPGRAGGMVSERHG